MFKQRMIESMVSLALSAGVTGSANLIVTPSGLSHTSPDNECGSGGSSGGGC
jgi:hypothetical protein